MRYDTKDRRCSHRLAILCRAWMRSDAGTFQRVQALDMSATGALLWVDRAPSAGTLLEMHVKLGSSDPYYLKGTVVWIRPAQAGGFELGVAFQRYWTADLRRLRHWHHGQRLRAS
jgi:hypothetical protein